MGMLHDSTSMLLVVRRGDMVLSRSFLDVCRGVLPLLQQLGAGMALVKKDVQGNIDRLQDRVDQSPEAFEDILNIVRDEIEKNVQESNTGCTKGLLWLCRAMRFVLGFMRKLAEDPNTTMYDAVSASYAEVLAPYHSWLTGSIFSLALKVVPSRETFLAKLEDGPDVEKQIEEYCGHLAPLLTYVMDFMEHAGVNFPDKV